MGLGKLVKLLVEYISLVAKVTKLIILTLFFVSYFIFFRKFVGNLE